MRKLALIAATVMLLTAGCGGASAGDDSTLTEMDYYNTDPLLTALPQLLDTCGKQAGVTIKRQVVPDLRTKVLQLVGSHDVPDLVLLDNPDLQQIAATGALSELGLATDGLYPNVVEAGRYQGKLYGVAPGVNALALYYNTKLFAAAGVAPPKTWDDLKAAAARLTTGNQHGIGFAVPATEEGSFQFEAFFLSAGGSLSSLDSPQSVAALQLLTDLVGSGSAPKDVLTWTQANLEEQFANGALAMMVNGPWQLPQLAKAGMTDFAIAPIPVPAGGTPSSALGGEVWAAGNGPRSAKATEVVKCLTAKDNSLSWSKLTNYVPSNEQAAHQLAETDPRFRSFVDEIADAKGRTATLGVNYPKYSQALWTAVQSALAGRATPAAALEAAQKQATGQ
ncbi:sugar ABC transporter substrate-binding protein [Kutzneria kofuensis]|uniref:Multiple sugar transport system substrate-binding protein n=1 Tax=Kutzneria kofuensis TaxID=103725 RepID=A0A7W9NMI4_9PSEU|nr:extracellular solute-binding protein [Kutzneria kofuensis]MBB5897383.1 multiple sugar transport system substrate-binding protein [Kutzneria kofuensis]